MSPIIQTPDPARKLQRQYRLTEWPDALLSPEIVPVVIVDDLAESPLDQEARACSGTISQAAVVAEYSHILIYQPTSPLPCLIDRLLITTGGNAQVQIGRPDVDVRPLVAATSGSKVFRDFATPGLPQTILGRFTNVAVQAATEFYDIFPRALSDSELMTALSLAVESDGINGALMIKCLTANTSLTVSLDWRELPPRG